MPQKMALRDSVAAVRTRLPKLSNLSRDQIELALLHFDSNVDRTVEAFEKDGAIEALQGWIDVPFHRENTLGKKRPPVDPIHEKKANVPLRPSQRVSSMFQMFAEGLQPAAFNNGDSTVCTPTSTTSSLTEQSITSTSTTEQHDESSQLLNGDIQSKSTQEIESSSNRHDSSSSNKNLRTNTTGNNKKLLTKSTKDLQRQTSTLANVEIVFNEEIKSSTKRIGDVFKQIHEILQEREVELYLELDQIKEQGLKMIERRQQRAAELRQRLDRCDRLNSDEIEVLRNDVKQFVSERRYDLGEQLGSIDRFEYDAQLVDSLNKFGRVIGINRKHISSTSSTVPELETETIDHSVTNVENQIQVFEPVPSLSEEINKNNIDSRKLETTIVKSLTPTNDNGIQNRNYHAPNYNRQNMYKRNESRNVPRASRPRPSALANGTTISVLS